MLHVPQILINDGGIKCGLNDTVREKREMPWFIPRTLKGKIAAIIWLITFLMVQYPIITWANRAQPYVLGAPFNFFWWWAWFNIVALVEIVIAWKVWEVRE